MAPYGVLEALSRESYLTCRATELVTGAGMPGLTHDLGRIVSVGRWSAPVKFTRRVCSPVKSKRRLTVAPSASEASGNGWPSVTTEWLASGAPRRVFGGPMGS